MASSVISRDELLEEAYRIADAQGLSALSVRSLAQACHVSVGTIYNHFASKDKLTTATIELFFRRSVFDGFCRLDVHKGFVDYCEDLYASLVMVLDRFRRCWLKGAEVLPRRREKCRPPARTTDFGPCPARSGRGLRKRRCHSYGPACGL